MNALKFMKSNFDTFNLKIKENLYFSSNKNVNLLSIQSRHEKNNFACFHLFDGLGLLKARTSFANAGGH